MASFSFHSGVAWTNSSISSSNFDNFSCNQAICSSISLRRAGRTVCKRFFSTVSMSTIWRRRVSNPVSCSSSSLGRVLTGGRTAAAKCARSLASNLSVLASLPVERAKARTRLGLLTTTGNLAFANSATSSISKPPVASSNDQRRGQLLQLHNQICKPWSLFPARQHFSCSCTAISSHALDTSIPTKISASPVICAPCARVSVNTASSDLSTVRAIIYSGTAILVARRSRRPNDNRSAVPALVY